MRGNPSFHRRESLVRKQDDVRSQDAHVLIECPPCIPPFPSMQGEAGPVGPYRFGLSGTLCPDLAAFQTERAEGREEGWDIPGPRWATSIGLLVCHTGLISLSPLVLNVVQRFLPRRTFKWVFPPFSLFLSLCLSISPRSLYHWVRLR